MAKYRIISLDGGGLRGLISTRLLERLQEKYPNWIDQADLIVGTSTGGIIALGLADGKPPAALTNLFKNSGKEIFDDSVFDNIFDFGQLIGAQYSNKVLKKKLTEQFGDKKLSSLKKKVAIPSFDLDNGAKKKSERQWKPKIFHNFDGEDSDGEQEIRNVALFTSAAPTYFPSVEGFIDGGVYANNPSMVGIAQAISQSNTPSDRCKLDEIVMLSVGTGFNPNYIKGKSLDWGYAQWIKPLINVLMDGVAGIADYQSKQLLNERYHRLQIVLPSRNPIMLDDVKQLDKMDKIATEFDLDDTLNWLEEQWIKD